MNELILKRRRRNPPIILSNVGNNVKGKCFAMTMFYSNRIKWQKLARKGSFRQYIEPTLFNIKAIGVLERTKRRL